jgi:hypothetical protein
MNRLVKCSIGKIISLHLVLHSQHQEMFLLLDNRDITGVQDNVLAEIN